MTDLNATGHDARFAPLSTRTPLVGRDREIATIHQLVIERRVPILTLTGPGGVGKTRLAVHIHHELNASFSGAVAFVPLAALFEAALLLPTIAQSLGARQVEGQTIDESIRVAFGDRPFLLVLDNLEQIAGVESTVARLVQASPRLTILATSRGPLRLTGEFELPIPPLSLPATVKSTHGNRVRETDSEAVQLFMQRAQAVAPSLELTAHNAETIAEICVRLDGLPLAIELAAARCRLLSPTDMLARLNDRLSLLTSGARDLPARQQTIRNTIRWSYDLLSPAQRDLFCTLSVFVDGFTIDAAERLVAAMRPDAEVVGTEAPIAILDGLDALADLGLVQRVEGVGQQSRLAMLETIRDFALESLRGAGRADETYAAHAALYYDLLERAQVAGKGEEDPAWLDAIDRDLGNIRAAMSWFLEQHDQRRFERMIIAVAPLWSARGYLAEGRQWVERAMALPPREPAPERMAVLRIGSWLASYQGDGQRALDFAEQALAMARADDDLTALVRVLKAMGVVHFYRGDMTEARRYWEEALTLLSADDESETDQVAGIMINLGVVAIVQHDTSRAEDHLRQALSISGNEGDRLMGAIAAMHLADLACERGDFSQAITFARRALTIAHELRHTLGQLSSVVTIAEIATRLGNAQSATRLLAAADAIREGAGYALGIVGTDEYRLIRERLREQLGNDSFNTIWEDGAALPLNDALVEASALLDGLEGVITKAVHREDPAVIEVPLTPRERDVLLLIAEGKTNQEIGDTLNISLRTAQTHVANILGKLGLTSRAAVAAYAVRAGWV